VNDLVQQRGLGGTGGNDKPSPNDSYQQQQGGVKYRSGGNGLVQKERRLSAIVGQKVAPQLKSGVGILTSSSMEKVRKEARKEETRLSASNKKESGRGKGLSKSAEKSIDLPNRSLPISG